MVIIQCHNASTFFKKENVGSPSSRRSWTYGGTTPRNMTIEDLLREHPFRSSRDGGFLFTARHACPLRTIGAGGGGCEPQRRNPQTLRPGPFCQSTHAAALQGQTTIQTTHLPPLPRHRVIFHSLELREEIIREKGSQEPCRSTTLMHYGCGVLKGK